MKDLEDIAYQVNEIRPLTGPVLETVQQQLLGERVFSSNAIEGNALTLRETILILQAGAILDKKRKREAIEALNLGRAYQKVEQWLSVEGAPWDEDRFLQIHKVLMSSINDRMAGCYRGQDAMIREGDTSHPTRGTSRILYYHSFNIWNREPSRQLTSQGN